MNLEIDDTELEHHDTNSEQIPKCGMPNCEHSAPVFRCTRCDCYLCDSCWKTQMAHQPEKCEHEQSLVNDFKTVYEALQFGNEEQASPPAGQTIEDVQDEDVRDKEIRKNDAGNMWFGVSQKEKGEYILGEGIAYENLVLVNPSSSPGITYPSLVSFIGETGRLWCYVSHGVLANIS
jgi:hypothetical protein